MKILTFVRPLLVITFAIALNGQAQDYPARIIKIIVPYPAGGGTDVVARLVAERLRDKWGQPVVIENRGGAGGNIGSEAVFKAAPDGYTLLFAAPGPLAINKSLYARINYEPEAFAPVTIVATSTNVLLVHSSVPARSVKELVILAKANPDKLNYSSSGSGTTSHLHTELFKMLTGVKLVHVPHKGNSQAITSLLSGETAIMFTDLGSGLPYVRTGRVRVLGVGSEKRQSALPDVPTIAETVPGYVGTGWYGVVAPPGTPNAVANTLSVAIAEGLKNPDSAKVLQARSLEAVAGTPAEMALFMKQESERWGRTIRFTGATAE